MITDAGAVERDLSAFTDNIDWTRTADTHETSVFGVEAKTFISGLTDATFSISGKYDSVATTGPKVVLEGLVGSDVARGFKIREEGTGAGKPEASGSCFITSYVESIPVGDVVTFSADAQVTGVVTVTNQV